jgi:3-hydroxyisobutyrate dehydrogenase
VRAASVGNVVITMLATPEALEQVLFGTDGLAAALSPGQVLIDMSTVGPDEIRSVVARLTNADDLLRTAVVRVQRKERRR